MPFAFKTASWNKVVCYFFVCSCEDSNAGTDRKHEYSNKGPFNFRWHGEMKVSKSGSEQEGPARSKQTRQFMIRGKRDAGANKHGDETENKTK